MTRRSSSSRHTFCGAPWRGGWLAAMFLVACEPPVEDQPALVQAAKFGIFYGGQVQDRTEIPLTFDRARQAQGLRIRLSQPLEQEAQLEWEVDVPWGRQSRDSRGRVERGRIVRLGQVTVRPGLTEIDQLIDFRPGDSPGVWNVRAELGGRLVLDRAVLIFDPSERRRLERKTEDEPPPSPNQ